MKNVFSKTKKVLARLHQSEQGAEGMEKLLIIGAIIIPLLGVLWYFKGELSSWLGGQWEEVESDSGSFTDQGFN